MSLPAIDDRAGVVSEKWCVVWGYLRKVVQSKGKIKVFSAMEYVISITNPPFRVFFIIPLRGGGVPRAVPPLEDTKFCSELGPVRGAAGGSQGRLQWCERTRTISY